MLKSIAKLLLYSLILTAPVISHAALQMHLELNGDLIDSSGNGNNGVLPSSSSSYPTYIDPAIIKQGLSFDGSNDYIRVPSFNPGSTFSVATWVRMDNIGSLNTFIEYVKTNNRNDFYLGYDKNQNQLFVELEDNNTTEGDPCGNPKFCTGIKLIKNRWYHITVTVTPTTLKVYLDGSLAYSTTHTTTVTFNPGGWLIGADSDSNPSTTPNNDYLDGRLDDIRIYNNELTQSDINNIIGLQAFLQFDLCTIIAGTSISDATGNGNNGIAYGGVSSTTGVICTAGKFNGSTGYVEIPHNASLNGTSELTYSAWINPTSWSGVNQIMAKSVHAGGSGRSQMGIFSESGVLKGRAETVGGTYEVSSTLPSTNTWHHVALVFAGDRLSLYVDGIIQAGSATRTFSKTTLKQTTDPINISKRVGSSQYYFNGAIDEIKIYTRAQAAEEISDYKNAPNPLSRTCSTCSGTSGSLLAYYKMDEASWGTAPNEITDDSGNNRPADNVNTANTVINGKVCRGGKITINGDAVDTQLDVNSTIGNKGTVSFWFRPDWTNSGSERNISRVLFDASLGDKYFKLAKTRNSSGPPSRWREKLILMFEDSSDRDLAVYSSDLSVFSTNTWVHLAATWDYPNKIFEIYVNGVRVANQIRNSNGNLTSTVGNIPNLNSLYLGDNRIASYNPYGVTNPANGTFDEVYIYNSVRTQSEIQANMNATHSCGGLDHIRIEHDGAALTCTPESVTFKACDSADCTSLHADPVSVTFSPSGWVGGDTQNILNGTGTMQLRKTTVGTATLGITSSSPAASGSVECYNTATATTGDCSLVFHDSGFIYDVPNITSCQTSALVSIQAVRLDATSQTCAPAFTGSRTINFWTTYSNPTTINNLLVLNNGSSNYNLASSAPGTGVPLSFDSSSKASFTVTYADAGQLTLNTSFTGTGTDSGLTMTGSDSFVAVPAKLYVYSDDTNSGCASNDVTCTAFKKAGQAFNLKIRAACANNSITPNFILNNIPLTATNTAPAINNGTIGVNTFNMADADNGEHIISNQTVSEVGVFTFTATPVANSYFGATVPAGTSTYIGRFTPDHFFMSSPTTTNRSDITSCLDTFTYMGEDFRLTYTLQARNSSDVVTQNYSGDFAVLKPQTGSASFNYGATSNNTNYSTRLSVLHDATTTNFINGTSSIASTLQLARATTIDGPLNPMAVGIAPQDSDGTLMKPPYNLSLTGGISTHTQIVGNLNIRYGRFNIENAFGPQTLNLAMTTQAQYFDGSNFIINTNDSCSVMNSSRVSFDQWTDNLSAGDTQVYSINSPALIGGDAALILTAPNSLNTLDDNNGSVRATVTVPGYLQYDWNGDGTIENPAGIATFGIYRGDDRIIFWQEMQQ